MKKTLTYDQIKTWYKDFYASADDWYLDGKPFHQKQLFHVVENNHIVAALIWGFDGVYLFTPKSLDEPLMIPTKQPPTAGETNRYFLVENWRDKRVLMTEEV